MKKNLAILICFAVLGSSTAVFAAPEYIDIDGTVIETTDYNGKCLIPVRAVAETMGYQVQWAADTKTVVLVKDAHYITFTIGIDGYTFAKIAPMPLGCTPVIIDDTAYVPFEILTEIMNVDGSYVDDGFVIKSNVESSKAVITSVDNGNFQVEDEAIGQVILVVNDDTSLLDCDGNVISSQDLKVNNVIEVVYGEAMTMSIPPLNNPISIKLIS